MLIISVVAFISQMLVLNWRVGAKSAINKNRDKDFSFLENRIREGSTDLFGLIDEASQRTRITQDKRGNWAEGALGISEEHKRVLDVLPCDDNTSCCGAILRQSTEKYIWSYIGDVVQIDEEVEVLAPEFSTTMMCKGWCPKGEGPLIDGFTCRPSKFGNGTILYRHKSRLSSEWQHEELNIPKWNITECTCH